METLPESGLAVLTGDLIDYTSLSPVLRAQAFDVLSEAAARMSAWPGASGSSGLDRIRGDGWQLALTAPGLALRAGLYLRACLRGSGAEFGTRRSGPPPLDTRISIAVGPHSPFSAHSLAAADGPAFVASGRALDRLPASKAMSFATAPRSNAPVTALTQAIVSLCDSVSRGWTDRQARTLQAMLRPGSGGQSEIADDLGIAQQTVSEHARAASAAAILDAVIVFEETFNSL